MTRTIRSTSALPRRWGWPRRMTREILTPGEDITRAEAASLVYTAATYKGDPARPSGNVAENENAAENPDASVVYMTTDISPEGLMRIYEALDWQPEGNVGREDVHRRGGRRVLPAPGFLSRIWYMR